MRRFATPLALSAAISCGGDEPPGGEDTGFHDTADPVAPGVQLTWSGSQVAATLEVVIDDPAGRDRWHLGMAETEAGELGWYGEDCFVGSGSHTHCHDVEGSALVLQKVGAPGDVVSGESTLFWPGMNLTWYLDDGEDCWVWGHDPDYYAPLGCAPLEAHEEVWAARHGCSGMDPHDPAPLDGRVALTFDDGPHPTITPQVLATLRNHGVPATFFMLGTNASDPDIWPLIEEIAADPLFEIANHTWEHADLALLPLGEAREEIVDTHELLATFGAQPPRRFRFPYGDSTCATADMVREELGLIPTGWHVDTADWCYAPDGVCTRQAYWRVPADREDDMRGWVRDQVRAFDGGVVLLHDIHQYTADVLDDLILDLQAEGFTFTSLDDAEAFPRHVADDPYPFPWVGESCDTSDDTCWQVEWHAWCEPTGDSTQPPTQGLCALPCDRASDCVDRDGAAPLACVEAGGGGTCLAESQPINGHCGDILGAVEVALPSRPGGAPVDVCAPVEWAR